MDSRIEFFFPNLMTSHHAFTKTNPEFRLFTNSTLTNSGLDLRRREVINLYKNYKGFYFDICQEILI